MAKPIQITREVQSVVGGHLYPRYNLIKAGALLRKLNWAKSYAEAQSKFAADMIPAKGAFDSTHVQVAKLPPALQSIQDTNLLTMSKNQDAARQVYPMGGYDPNDPKKIVAPLGGIDRLAAAAAAKTQAALKGDGSVKDAPFADTSRLNYMPGSSINSMGGNDALNSQTIGFTGANAVDAVSNAGIAAARVKGLKIPGPAWFQAVVQGIPQLFMLGTAGMDVTGVRPSTEDQQQLLAGDVPAQTAATANIRNNIEAQRTLDPGNKELEAKADKADADYRALVAKLKAGDYGDTAADQASRADIIRVASTLAARGSDIASLQLAASSGSLAAIKTVAASTGLVAALLPPLMTAVSGGSVGDMAASAGRGAFMSTPLAVGYMAARQVAQQAATKAGTQLGASLALQTAGRAIALPVAAVAQAVAAVDAGWPSKANQTAFDARLREQAYIDVFDPDGATPGGHYPYWRGLKGVAQAAYDPQNPALSSTGAVSNNAQLQYMEHYETAAKIKQMMETENHVRDHLVTTWSKTMPANYVESISQAVAPMAAMHFEHRTDPTYRKQMATDLAVLKSWADQAETFTYGSNGKPISATKAFTPAGVNRLLSFANTYGPVALQVAYGAEELPANVHDRFRSWINSGQ